MTLNTGSQYTDNIVSKLVIEITLSLDSHTHTHIHTEFS